MIDLVSKALVASFLLVAGTGFIGSESPARPLGTTPILSDGFESGGVLGWSSAVGLQQGELCDVGTTTCTAGTLCCYPCGFPGCAYECMVATDTCPLIP